MPRELRKNLSHRLCLSFSQKKRLVGLPKVCTTDCNLLRSFCDDFTVICEWFWQTCNDSRICHETLRRDCEADGEIVCSTKFQTGRWITGGGWGTLGCGGILTKFYLITVCDNEIFPTDVQDDVADCVEIEEEFCKTNGWEIKSFFREHFFYTTFNFLSYEHFFRCLSITFSNHPPHKRRWSGGLLIFRETYSPKWNSALRFLLAFP